MQASSDVRCLGWSSDWGPGTSINLGQVEDKAHLGPVFFWGPFAALPTSGPCPQPLVILSLLVSELPAAPLLAIPAGSSLSCSFMQVPYLLEVHAFSQQTVVKLSLSRVVAIRPSHDSSVTRGGRFSISKGWTAVILLSWDECKH